jgi:hypothetical protein
MAYVPNQRRRWFGLFYLITSAGLLIWGLTLLRPVLRGWLFVGYWFACFLGALLALVTAWLDLRAIRRHARAERRELLSQALTRISHELDDHGDEPPRPGAKPPQTPGHDA